MTPQEHDDQWRAHVVSRHAEMLLMSWYVRERAIKLSANVVDARPLIARKRVAA